jgi:hypothetical protein
VFSHYDYRINVQREIAAVRDTDGWRYVAVGNPMPYERAEYSRRKRVRDRLNRAIVLEYLHHLGFKVLADEFWQPVGKVATIHEAREI